MITLKKFHQGMTSAGMSAGDMNKIRRFVTEISGIGCAVTTTPDGKCIIDCRPDLSESDPQEMGSLGEGEETASTDSWESGETDEGTATGLKLRCMTRVAYYDEGDHILYGYVRELLFDNTGRLVSVGAETRVEIDAPVAVYP